MAVANDKYKFVFLAEPRTASRSVRDALLTLDGSYEAGTHHLEMRMLLRGTYLRHRQRSYYTTFCFVRNPADILITRYLQSPVKEGDSLKDFLCRLGDKRPIDLFFKHAPGVDYVLRYEDLQDELDSVLHRLQCHTVKLGVVGKTEGKKPWFRYYSANELHYILAHFSEIAQYGYAIEINRQITAKRA